MGLRCVLYLMFDLYPKTHFIILPIYYYLIDIVRIPILYKRRTVLPVELVIRESCGTLSK